MERAEGRILIPTTSAPTGPTVAQNLDVVRDERDLGKSRGTGGGLRSCDGTDNDREEY